ncbi:hypothetical protein niasHT_005573 [Heterodera trifolii]|uniref:Uncharacterized protein n=1 Tax=Heterodera trifolii TaxID=157864 RepID=A0ABD2LQH6_9BILA
MVGRGSRQWREGVRADGRQNGCEGSAAVERGGRGREGVRADGRRNGGEGSAAVERGGPRRRREGSVEERASAPPGRRTSGEGAALFNAKYHGPANCINGRLVNASANHHLGFNPARRNSRAFHPSNTKSRATPIQHPQIPTPHRPAHQPPSRTHLSRRIPPPIPAHHTAHPPNRHGPARSSPLRSAEKINR